MRSGVGLSSADQANMDFGKRAQAGRQEKDETKHKVAMTATMKRRALKPKKPKPKKL